jgi:hypothetical protein
MRIITIRSKIAQVRKFFRSPAQVDVDGSSEFQNQGQWCVVSIRLPVLVFMVTVALLTAGGHASAGWITIRNDTKQELAVQEVTVVGGKPQFGKVVKLLPGESIRELKAAPGSKSVIVAEVAKPNTVIARGTLEWKKDDLVFSIRTDMKLTTIALSK